jgi:hypothetical protein
MSDIKGKALAILAQRKAEVAAKFGPPRPRREVICPDLTAIVLGRSPDGRPVVLPELPRLEHMHVIGDTGSGKSTFLKHCIRQDIQRGRGVCVVDPHGNHPDGLYRSMMLWLYEKGYHKTRTVHLVDPNAPTHTVGFNPLERPDKETDLSVIANTTLDAFERVWGDEDTLAKPTIRRVLKGTFSALAELGLTISDAELLLDPHDKKGVRAWALSKLTDRYSRGVLDDLHQMALDERNKRDFRAEVMGPKNRLAEFVSAPTIRTIIGQTARALDIRAALDEGHIILVNLSPGTRVSDADAELLGRLLTRFIFFHAKRRRRPDIPFFFYLDECQRYLSGDVPELLGEARKYGLGCVLGHQWLAQLGQPDDPIREAVLNGPNLKVVFRLKNPKEAEELAETVIPFDLEQPITALTKPAVVGYERTTFKSWGTAEHRAQSSAKASSFSESDSESEGESESSSAMAAEGLSASTSMMVPTTGWMVTPEMMTAGTGSSNSSAGGSQSGSSRTWARSTTRSESSVKANMEGTSTSEGVTEGIVPVFKDLPGGVHSLENVRYMAARELRSLGRGNAFISYVGIDGWKGAKVAVARVLEAQAPAEGADGVRSAMLNASPSALPTPDAQAAVDRREQEIFAAAAGLNSPTGEAEAPRAKTGSTRAAASAKGDPPSEEPDSWRVAAPKRKAKSERRSHGKP